MSGTNNEEGWTTQHKRLYVKKSSKKIINKQFDIVIYHGPSCPDGICSLYCAKKFLGADVKIQGCSAGIDPKGYFKNKKILFVDLCPSLDFIKNNIQIINQLTILDHHNSTQTLYEKEKEYLDSLKNLNLVLDMTKAGCQITWDFFFENVPRPWFVDYIADRDLWKWELFDSKEINAALYENEYFNFRNYTQLDNLLVNPEEKKNQLIHEGKIILRMQQREIDNGIKQAKKAVFKVGSKLHNVWLLGNINPALRSEVGNQLVNKKFEDETIPEFAVIWLFEPESNEWWMSMRGAEGTSPDLSVIANHFGGGGHKLAAGFSIKNGECLLDYFTVCN